MQNYTTYTLTTSGGTLNTVANSNVYVPYSIESAGPVTLSSSFSIVDTLQIVNNPINIRWNAEVTLGGFTVTIGGIVVPQDQVNQPGTFELLFDGSGYLLQYFPDFTVKPQENYGVTTVTVPSIGGTLVISPGVDKRTYVLQGGPTTLSSSYTVSGATSGVTDGSSIRVVLTGGVTKGSNNVTIFGESISSYDCLNGGIEVFAEFDASTSSYVATYTNKNVPLAKLDTTGYISGDNGKLVTYDFASKQFVASFLSASSLPSTFKGINITETYITSGQLLTSNTTPITLLPASGSISTVEIPVMIVLRYKYGTTAYTTNTTIDIEYTGPTVTEAIASKNCLGFTVTGIDFVPPVAFGTPVVRISPNYSLQLSTRTGNPAAGDGDLIVYVISTTLNI
jgi:hypothetical protein